MLERVPRRRRPVRSAIHGGILVVVVVYKWLCVRGGFHQGRRASAEGEDIRGSLTNRGQMCSCRAANEGRQPAPQEEEDARSNYCLRLAKLKGGGRLTTGFHRKAVPTRETACREQKTGREKKGSEYEQRATGDDEGEGSQGRRVGGVGKVGGGFEDLPSRLYDMVVQAGMVKSGRVTVGVCLGLGPWVWMGRMRAAPRSSSSSDL